MKQGKYIILIFLVAFNLRLGISSVPPILSEIKESLALTNFQASLLTSIPVICMGIFAFLVSTVQKKIGRSKGIFYLLILLGCSTLSRSLVNHYVFLLLTTFFIGAAIAIIGPLLSGFIKEQFPDQSGLLIGVYSLSMGLGSVSVSSTMLPLNHFFQQRWQSALGIWGGLALIVAGLWLFFSPKNKAETVVQKQPTVKTPFKISLLIKMILFFGIQSGIFYGFSTWISAFLISKGITTVKSVYLLTLFTAVQMAGSFVIPTLMDKFGSIKKWIFFCTISMLLAALGLLSLENTFAITSSIILMALGASGLFPIAMLLPIRASKSPHETSILTSFVQAFGYILGGIIPVIIGILVDLWGNYDVLLWQVMLGTFILLIIGFSNVEKGADDVK